MNNITRIKELTEKSGADYKVYLLSDGSEEMEISSNAENSGNSAVMMRSATLVNDNTGVATYSWCDGQMTFDTTHTIGATLNAEGARAKNRMYLQFNKPSLPQLSRVKKAVLKLYQSGADFSENAPLIALYKLSESISLGECTPAYSDMLRDFEKAKNESGVYYEFDVTSIINDSTSFSLVLKMLDENMDGNVTVRGPALSIIYERTTGSNSAYRSHSHSLGFFGNAAVDLACGTLSIEAEDFSWGGNLMPVNIKHFYNSAFVDNDSMKFGEGWRLNVVQTMGRKGFVYEGEEISGYSYTDENGDDHFFKPSDEDNVFECIDDSESKYNTQTRILSWGGQKLYFNEDGMLIKICDEFENSMQIIYADGKISCVKDGVGREFAFSYDANDYLTKITAPDNTEVNYGYTNKILSSVTYQDGSRAEIDPSSRYPAYIELKNADGEGIYKVCYTYNNTKLKTITEYGAENGTYVLGTTSTYSYSGAYNRTILEVTEPADSDAGETESTITRTTYIFDNDDNVISEYSYIDGVGMSVSCDGEGINPFENEGSMKAVPNVNNLLANHCFAQVSNWSAVGAIDTIIESEDDSKFGKTVLCLTSQDSETIQKGVCQSASIDAGEHTFSCYVKTDITNGGAYLRVIDSSNNIIATSEKIKNTEGQLVRLVLPFESTQAQTINAQILIDGEGTATFSSSQLEKSAFANSYNMLYNGALENSIAGWETNDETNVTLSTSVASVFNDQSSLKIKGDLNSERFAYQDVKVKSKASTKESFALSGWCWSYGVIAREREGVEDVKLRLRADIHYEPNEEYESNIESFSSDFVSNMREWQYLTLEFEKTQYRKIDFIRVYCENSFNTGVSYFDDLSLIRTAIQTNLDPSDFAPEYNGEYDETQEQTFEAPAFEEAIDDYGNNLTETTFTDGELGTMYRSFSYDRGNELSEEVDARGRATSYVTDEQTSRNEVVTDRCGNKTEYEYDEKGRTVKVTSKDRENIEKANVSYSYDAFDNLSEIARGDGLKYVLTYNAFHNLESIGVDGKDEKLISYAYKNGNGRLKEMTYANGDKMKATYNTLGQMVTEKWYNSADTLTAHYKYAYDKDGNIVRSIDILSLKEYNYNYENGALVRSAEFDIVLDSNEFVISKTAVLSIAYNYNSDGQLVYKKISPVDAPSYEQFYENKEDGAVVLNSKYQDTKTLTHSKTDSFGRKVFDELQGVNATVTRQFSYHLGEKTNIHENYGKNKSVPTTNLVKDIVFSDGRIISYEYDGEERITKVTDSVDGITEYTYDALGQLLTETVTKDEVTSTVNSMTYDNYGNISSKNGVTYTYGDQNWKDKLTKVGDKTITYDAQGNPVNYLGHTLTWEKGRQLKSFDNISYKYNANGIRTSKIVNGVEHKYILDGTKIIAEIMPENILQPMYNNEDEICGIISGDIPYYFVKNLQGDVIAITDHNGETVARYSYDAWGACTITLDTEGIGSANPFRYRGYYYDTDTNLYYLQSRYYDASVGRFVNGDEAVVLNLSKNILGYNLFNYCRNIPVTNFDPTGFWVASINLSWGFVSIVGLNLSANILFDSSWDIGLFIGVTFMFGIFKGGAPFSVTYCWSLNKIKDYLNVYTVTFGGAMGGLNGALMYNYYKYPSNKKKLFAVQLSLCGVGLYRETMQIDEGIYIPLKPILNKILSFRSALRAKVIAKLISAIRKLRVQIL